VLNALRHQRFRHDGDGFHPIGERECSTPYGIKGFGTDPMAKLLNMNRRAQRLTASKVSAHQSSGILRATLSVLNALRHQRFRHRVPSMTLQRLLPCSTPYGIKGFGTPAARTLAGQSSRNNLASRIETSLVQCQNNPKVVRLIILEPKHHKHFNTIQAS
jgi:hypothetical protein